MRGERAIRSTMRGVMQDRALMESIKRELAPAKKSEVEAATTPEEAEQAEWT